MATNETFRSFATFDLKTTSKSTYAMIKIINDDPKAAKIIKQLAANKQTRRDNFRKELLEQQGQKA